MASGHGREARKPASRWRRRPARDRAHARRRMAGGRTFIPPMARRTIGAAIWHSGMPPSHWPCRPMSPKKTSYPKQDIRVLLLEGVSQTAVDVFTAAGYSQIELHSKALPEDELKARIAEAHIVGIRSRSQLTAGVLAEAKRTIAIGCFCIGT